MSTDSGDQFETGMVNPIYTLQRSHEEAVQIVQRAQEIQEIIEKFQDSRVHWLDWYKSMVRGQPIYAECGAVVHDGRHWRSFILQYKESLSGVTCEECIDLPEYNVKLLAETDIDGKNNTIKSFRYPDPYIEELGKLNKHHI